MKNTARRKLIAYNMKKAALEEAVLKMFDIDICDKIMKSLRYPDDTLIVNQQNDSVFYSNEAEDDDIWIWVGFLPPGIISFEVSDPLITTF